MYFLSIAGFQEWKAFFWNSKEEVHSLVWRPQTFKNMTKCKTCQDEQMVDVHFLTGTETTGFNLHINGEGAGREAGKQGVCAKESARSVYPLRKVQLAFDLLIYLPILHTCTEFAVGSRDAKFLVHLNEKARLVRLERIA